jgi:hypothetical protein
MPLLHKSPPRVPEEAINGTRCLVRSSIQKKYLLRCAALCSARRDSRASRRRRLMAQQMKDEGCWSESNTTKDARCEDLSRPREPWHGSKARQQNHVYHGHLVPEHPSAPWALFIPSSGDTAPSCFPATHAQPPVQLHEGLRQPCR